VDLSSKVEEGYRAQGNPILLVEAQTWEVGGVVASFSYSCGGEGSQCRVSYPYNLDTERCETVWYAQPESICRATTRKILCYVMVFVKWGDVLQRRERTAT